MGIVISHFKFKMPIELCPSKVLAIGECGVQLVIHPIERGMLGHMLDVMGTDVCATTPN